MSRRHGPRFSESEHFLLWECSVVDIWIRYATEFDALDWLAAFDRGDWMKGEGS